MLKRLSDITVHHVSQVSSNSPSTNERGHVDFLERRWWVAVIALYSSALASQIECDPADARASAVHSPLEILCPRAIDKGHSTEAYMVLIFLLAMVSRKRIYEQNYGAKYSRDNIRRLPLVSEERENNVYSLALYRTLQSPMFSTALNMNLFSFDSSSLTRRVFGSVFSCVLR
jgi:hypothetical protein